MPFLQLKADIIPLGVDPLRIGRSPDQDLILDDVRQSVSRVHAVVSPSGLRWYVEDLGSRNGTRLNNTLLRSARQGPLRHGDLIQVGPHRLQFLTEVEEPDQEILRQVSPSTVFAQVRYQENNDLLLTQHQQRMQLLGLLCPLVRHRDDWGRCLQDTLQLLASLFGPERAWVGLWESGERSWSPDAFFSHGGSGKTPFLKSTYLLHRVLREGQSFMTTSLPPSTDVVRVYPDVGQTTLVAPVLAGSRPIGVLYLESATPQPSPLQADLETLTLLGTLLGTVLGHPTE